MRYILIVEDSRETREGLRAVLQDVYKNWIVDVAGSVEEAKTKIKTSILERIPYDLVIQDYQLPLRTGGNPEGSLDLTDYLVGELPNALIIQITAFPDSPQLKDKVIQPMLANPDRRLMFVEKDMRSSWVKRLSQIAGDRLLGDPITKLLDELFPIDSSPAHAQSSARFAWSPESTSLTQSLASLRNLIVESWDHLSPERKASIKERLKIDDGVKPVKVTLF
jgi:CheY-like chemotaxis protein